MFWGHKELSFWVHRGDHWPTHVLVLVNSDLLEKTNEGSWGARSEVSVVLVLQLRTLLASLNQLMNTWHWQLCRSINLWMPCMQLIDNIYIYDYIQRRWNEGNQLTVPIYIAACHISLRLIKMMIRKNVIYNCTWLVG